MISKAVRSPDFSACVSYICSKSDSIRMQNIVAADWKNAASEMRAVASTNRTSKPAYHHILSFPLDEKLDDEKMFLAASRMLEKLGFEDHQAVHAIHKDCDHWHVHTVVNQVNFDGKAVRLDNDFHKRPVFAREIEIELDLQRYQQKKRDPNLHFPDKKIAQIRDAALHKNRQDFEKFLSEIGVSMTEKSSKARAVNFRFIDAESGAEIPGSKIDVALSSPSKFGAHFAEKTNVAAAKTAAVRTEKSTWNTSKNMIVQRAAADARSFDELRSKLAREGLSLEVVTRENGNRGVVFLDQSGNRIAGSKISSDLSFSKLDKRFDQLTIQAAPPPKQKSQWEQYSEARKEHFQRIGKSSEQIKVELEKIKKAKEKLWKEYRYKTSLIPQCFEPKYRGMMRRIERNNFEKSKLRLEKQAKSLRDQRFVSFDDWKSGSVLPKPKPKPPTILQKLLSFFSPIAKKSEIYHQSHTYHPKPQSYATPKIEIVSGMDFDMNDLLKEASLTATEQLKVVSSTYANQLRQSNTTQAKSTRSNNYVARNHDQR
jgi:hypothetical protein